MESPPRVASYRVSYQSAPRNQAAAMAASNTMAVIHQTGVETRPARAAPEFALHKIVVVKFIVGQIQAGVGVLLPAGAMVRAAFGAGQRARRHIFAAYRTHLWSLRATVFIGHGERGIGKQEMGQAAMTDPTPTARGREGECVVVSSGIG